MSQPVSITDKIKAFIIGVVGGLAMYALYIKSITNGVFAVDLGLVYFPFQFFFSLEYPIQIYDDSGAGGGTIIALFIMVIILYGYIFLSFRLSPYLALGTFLLGSTFCFISLNWDLPCEPLVNILTWPKFELRDVYFSSDVAIWRPTRIFTYCVTVGLWYAGLVCGLRALFMPFKGRCKTKDVPTEKAVIPQSTNAVSPANLQAIPILDPTNHGTVICPGWFVGKCTNSTVGTSSNLLLSITGATKTDIHGELGLSGDLGGGGIFHGNIKGTSFAFTTCVPDIQTVIEWQGVFADNQISGEYTVKSDDPKLVAEGAHSQRGAWWCRFIRGLSPAIPNKIDQVYIYHDGLYKGPLNREFFERNIHTGCWPASAIVALEDCTCWTTISEYLVSKTGGQN